MLPKTKEFEYINPYDPVPLIPEGIDATWDVIRERQIDGSQPGERTDPHRVAIAGEGGSVRSVIGNSVMKEFLMRGIYSQIEEYHGSSSNVLVGAYYIAKQAHLGTRVYYEDLCTSKFIDRKRTLGSLTGFGDPIMSLDYLFHVVDNIKPLDWQAVVDSPIRLHPLITSLETGELVDLSDYETVEELKLRVKASCVLPVIAGKPINVAGHQAIDAGLHQSFPYKNAIKNGASHVVVVKTQPEGHVPDDGMGWAKPILRHVFRIDPRIIEQAERRPENYARDDKDLRVLSGAENLNGAKVTILEPLESDYKIPRLTKDPEVIKAGIRVGEMIVDRVLGPVAHAA